MSQSKEVHREYMRKRRAGSNKQTEQLKGSEDITHIDTVQDAEFVVKCLKNKPTKDVEAIQVLPLERVQLIRGILADRRNAGLFDDSADRWQRAVDYREWELEK